MIDKEPLYQYGIYIDNKIQDRWTPTELRDHLLSCMANVIDGYLVKEVGYIPHLLITFDKYPPVVRDEEWVRDHQQRVDEWIKAIEKGAQ